MKKIIISILITLALVFSINTAFAQTTNLDPQTENALKSYLESKNKNSNQNNSNTSQALKSSANNQASSGQNRAWTLFMLILYAITFLLFWLFLLMWIFTLLRWSKMPRPPRTNIGHDLR